MIEDVFYIHSSIISYFVSKEKKRSRMLVLGIIIITEFLLQKYNIG